MFFLTRINVKQYQRPGVPNEIIKEFENRIGNNARVTGQGGSMEFDPDEYSRDDGRGSRRYLDLSGSSTNSSMSHQKLTRKRLSFVNNGRQLYQMASRATETRPSYLLCDEPKLPFLMGSTPANDPSISGNFSEHAVYGHHGHNGLRGSGGTISSWTGGDYSPLPQEPISHVGSSMDDTQSDHCNSQLHTSHIGDNPVQFCPPNLMGSSFPIGNTSIVRLPPIRSEGHLKFHGYKHVSYTESYDPSNSRYLFSPGMPTEEGTETLLSVQTSNSHGFPDASRHEVEYGGQPCGGLEPPPDFIPLSSANCFDKNMGPPHSNSPRKDTSFNYSSECMVADNSRGMRPYHAEEEYHPSYVKPRFRSDTEQRRTSVFSRLAKASYAGRLSKTPEASHLSKSPEAFQKYEAQEPVTNLSLDQLARVLSLRRELETTKAPQWSSIDDDEKIKSMVAKEPCSLTSHGELEASNDVIDEDLIAEDAIVEESSEHLFLNFKRKSEIRRLSGENEMNVCADSGLDEGTLQRGKRRKLQRPSFNDEECQDVQASTREIVGVKPVVQKREYIVNGELSRPSHLDNDNKKSSVSEASLHYVASDKTDENSEALPDSQLDDKNKDTSASHAHLGNDASYKTKSSSESLSTRRKEAFNRNLRWFLQKSVDNHAKVSNLDDVNEKTKDDNEKTNDDTHMVSDVSVLEANSKHGDKEASSITNKKLASFVDEKIIDFGKFLPLRKQD